MSKNDTTNMSNINSFSEKISILDRNSLLHEHANSKKNNIEIKQKEKDVPFSFGDINFNNNSSDKSDYKIGNTNVTNNNKDNKSKPNYGVSNEGSLNIEGKKIIDNNATWKTGLNKQEDINLAIISNNNNKKKEVDLFDQIGDLGSVSYNEKITPKNEYKSEYVDEFEESNKNKLIKQQTVDDDANSNLEKLLNSGGEIKFDEQGRYFDVNTGKWVLPDYSKQNQDLFDRIKKLRSSLDNKADISGMLKWKNNTGKVNLDQPLPDLSRVKSKLNTGIVKKKMSDDKFSKEAEKYKKQLDDFNKENEKKMKDYRDQAIKLEKAKLDNTNQELLRKELRSNYAEKLTGK